MTVTQDVPVTVLLSAQLHQLAEPQLPAPEVRVPSHITGFQVRLMGSRGGVVWRGVVNREQVQIFLPPLKQLSAIIDKLSRISHHLMIVASMSGELTFKVESDVVSVGTFYSKLKNPVRTCLATFVGWCRSLVVW